MTFNRTLTRLFGLLALAGASISCGDVARSGRSPVFLVVDLLQARAENTNTLSGTLFSDVITNVRTPAPCSAASPCPTIFADIGSVVLRTSLKDVGTATTPASPSTNNDVTITRYHVRYRRADGRNVEGVDVPYAFDGAVTGTIPGGGNQTLTFEIVRHVAKEETPLAQLATSPTVIASIADVTFYGQDQVGNEINATGSILIEFGNFGDF
jgi:hypothetical protein